MWNAKDSDHRSRSPPCINSITRMVLTMIEIVIEQRKMRYDNGIT